MWDDVINKDGWLHWLATNDPILSKSIFVDSTCFIWGTLTSLTFNKAHHFGQVRRKNLPEAGRREPVPCAAGPVVGHRSGLQREGAGLLQSCAADQFGEGVAKSSLR